MKDNIQNNFENFIRGELGNMDSSPSGDTWSKIAAQQQKRNFWLKARYYSPFAIPAAAAVLLLVSVIWWRPLSPNDNLTSAGRSDAAFLTSFFSPQLAPVNIGQSLPDATALRLNPENQVKHINSFPPWYKQNNVPVDRIRFIAEEGVKYQSPVSGNTVSIPANSLVYADGTPVQGEVDLFFREYRTIPDILAADIPMHYADERGQFFFNSGGMFDVRVSQDNNELFMAPGLAYDVDFKANKRLTNTSLFYFDESKNKWDFVSGAAFDQNAKEVRTFDVRTVNNSNRQNLPVISDEATVIRENTRTKEEDACLPALPSYPKEAEPVQWVKDAVKLGHDLAYGKRTIPKWFRVNPKGTDTYFAVAMDRSEIELVYGIDKSTRFFPQDINGVFTELSALKNCYFLRTSDTLTAMQAKEGTNSVDHLFNNTNIWNSIEIRKDVGDKCFIILRQNKGDAIQIHARICSSTEDGKDIYFNPDAVLNNYWMLRSQRLANMSKELTELRQFMTVSSMFQQENEWCLQQKEWLQYFDKNIPQMRARYDALVREGMLDNDQLVQTRIDEWAAKSRELVFGRYMRGAGNLNSGQKLASLLRLSGFGAYNCDQIYRFVLTVGYFEVAASFQTSDGTPIVPAKVNMLDEPTRMFFSMTNTSKVYAIPGRNLEMLVTDKDGRVYFMPGTTYGKLPFKSQKSMVFTLTEITNKVQSPMGWAEVLQI